MEGARGGTEKGRKKCQEAQQKLNLSSKWLLNKRLRQQNEIIHKHSQQRVHSERSAGGPRAFRLYNFMNVDKYANPLELDDTYFIIRAHTQTFVPRVLSSPQQINATPINVLHANMYMCT